jgi:hypothetical protein
VLESAWAETPLSSVHLTAEIDDRVSALLRWFQGELCPDIGPSRLITEESLRSYFSDGEIGPEGTLPTRFLRHKMEDYRNSVFDPIQLEWADQRKFGGCPFASQRLLLFLRAIVKSPDMVVLDEPFSGLDTAVVQKCNAFLAHGETRIIRYTLPHISMLRDSPVFHRSDVDRLNLSVFKGMTKDQSLVFISHRKGEVPGIVREWVCLPEPRTGQAPRFGRFSGPMEVDPNRWRQVWGQPELVQKENRLYVSDEQRRLAKNAYHYRYFRTESLEKRRKRNDRLRGYLRNASAGRREELLLRGYHYRNPMPISAEKILNHSIQTTRDAADLIEKFRNPNANRETYEQNETHSTAQINSSRSTSSLKIVHPQSRLNWYLRRRPIHGKVHYVWNRAQRHIFDAEAIISRIKNPHTASHSIIRRAERILQASQSWISKTERCIASVNPHMPHKDRIVAEAQRLLRGNRYRLTITSRRLENLARSRASAGAV